MSDLNRRAAAVLGWEYNEQSRYTACTGSTPGERRNVPFDPSTNRNHLTDYLLPEVERRGLQDQWLNAMQFEHPGDGYDFMWFIATAPCHLQCEAAVKVLEENRHEL